VKFREIEDMILKDGWKYAYSTGSHYYYKHPSKPGRVTIPYHGKDLNPKTVKSIFRQAGL
jgi:predicted RNA binding protein YcfA (HicA-like mRNA interferase family)